MLHQVNNLIFYCVALEIVPNELSGLKRLDVA